MKKNLADCMEMDAKEFEKTAEEIFAPMYPVLAEQIIEETGKIEGLCLDIGTGTGLLPIELAKRTKLVVYALDISEEMCKIACRNVLLSKFSGRIIVIKGDVHFLPFRDNFFDLVVSRGSFLFWRNQIEAFKEIYRVLKLGGITFIGGGFGREETIRERIKIEMKKKFAENKVKRKINRRWEKNTPEDLSCVLECASIPEFNILSDGSGIWVKIRKE